MRTESQRVTALHEVEETLYCLDHHNPCRASGNVSSLGLIPQEAALLENQSQVGIQEGS